MKMDDLISKRRMIVTCGTGGVGKTTLSAAIAMRAAQLGRKSIVVTIDPAKRLATALGIPELADDPKDLTENLRAQGIQMGDGRFYAMMPDTRRTFETLLETLGPDRAFVERVKQNSIFQMVSTDYSGSHEYVAIFKLGKILEDDDFDFIVLDTPPSRNTVHFIRAPQLLQSFYEEKVIRWIILPANRILSSGMKKVLGVLEKLTGGGFVKDLFEFAGAMFEIQKGFQAMLATITEVFRSERAGFLFVTAPSPSSLQELRSLVVEVESNKYGLDGFILNRSLQYLNQYLSQATSTTRKNDEPARDPTHRLVHALIEQELGVIQNVQDDLKKIAKSPDDSPLFLIMPELARDIHSIEDLKHVAHHLGQKACENNPAEPISSDPSLGCSRASGSA